jgi:hypothetical protein
VRTVEHVRRRMVLHGLRRALGRKKQTRPPRERKLDGEGGPAAGGLMISTAGWLFS